MSVILQVEQKRSSKVIERLCFMADMITPQVNSCGVI